MVTVYPLFSPLLEDKLEVLTLFCLKENITNTEAESFDEANHSDQDPKHLEKLLYPENVFCDPKSRKEVTIKKEVQDVHKTQVPFGRNAKGKTPDWIHPKTDQTVNSKVHLTNL